MNIAVVGDVHGHLHLLYAILGRWQAETGRRIAVILQVGDLGAFSPDSALDPATRRHAEHDPEELGFADFAGSEPPETLLAPRPPLVFVPGNHEGFDFLERCAARAPADEATYSVAADDLILGIRSGRIATFVDGETSVRIGAVSGAANLKRKASRHERAHLQEIEAVQLAEAGRGGFDILLTHDCPDGLWATFRGGTAGSGALRFVVEEVAPQFAFFGHYNRVGEWTIGRTWIVGLSDCGYDHRRSCRINEGGIVMLEWTNDGEQRLERVAPQWLSSSTRNDWRHWGSPRK